MGSTVASVFELLFKYRPVVFEKGAFSFAASGAAVIAVLAAAALALLALRGYRRVSARTTPRDRVVLATLRGVAVLLLAACLLRPTLVVSAAVPQRNVLAVLLDDSRSMRVADVNGRSRGEVARELFAANGAFLGELGRQFTVRVFRFARDAEQVGGAAALRFDGTRTRVSTALAQVQQELAGAPLAGIVLVSDGADNADSAAAPRVAGERRVPIYAVGMGQTRLPRDVELSRVEVPRRALRGSALAVDVTLTQSGYAGRTVQLVAEDAGRVVASQPVKLPADGEAARVRLRVPLTEGGARAVRVRVAAQDGETITANNARNALVTVRDRRQRILYVEGEPRFELKFLRQAVRDDPTLQVVALQRTADGKFLRLGVDDSTQLRDGFPTSRAELFAYQAVILGSVEASFFTVEQLRLLADFVGERGGGLLALGGPLAFAEGGYAGTPLADVLPLQLGAPGGETPAPVLATLRVTPTPAGRAHAALELADTEDASAERWRTLPALTAVNQGRGVKPGASVLLTGAAGENGSGGTRPVLVSQRFGRGVALALPVQDTWMWQMHADMPLADQTHERFWRQLLRWLVSEVPEPVTVAAEGDGADSGAPLTLRASVRDTAFRGIGDAQVVARVRAPSGTVQEVPLAWTGDADGDYRGVVMPAERGTHVLEAVARRGAAEPLDAEASYAMVAEPVEESFDVGLRSALLERLAEE
ncbi:MAG TPA: hypothetical protein VFY16_09035, partial [Gemmatimonadaceae bacterium]|nr:hypothetical protein [Gemmatimonadaceae bacterium]